MGKSKLRTGILALVVAAALAALLLHSSCSNANTFKGDFALGQTFQLENMEYRIDSIDPPKSKAVGSNISVSYEIMYVNVDCKALKDGAKPNLQKMLTMRDSTSHIVEKPSIYSGDIYTEDEVGKLSEGQESNFTILYEYDRDQPWYELTLHDNTRDEKTLGSFKFSCDPDAGESSQIE